jgi:hypothetical protein
MLSSRALYVSFFTFLLSLSLPLSSIAQQGCCSSHGGISYCGDSGYYICRDGTRSPSCQCSSMPSPTPRPTPRPTVRPTAAPAPQQKCPVLQLDGSQVRTVNTNQVSITGTLSKPSLAKAVNYRLRTNQISRASTASGIARWRIRLAAPRIGRQYTLLDIWPVDLQGKACKATTVKIRRLE